MGLNKTALHWSLHLKHFIIFITYIIIVFKVVVLHFLRLDLRPGNLFSVDSKRFCTFLL